LQRLSPEAGALAVKIAGKHIGEVTELSIRKADQWFTELPQNLNDKQNEIAVRAQGNPRAPALPERCRPRLPHAVAQSGTLSGGESQRIRLASRSAPASPACSMCWTSRRSACTSATTPACSTR
jgi:excinuclease ABC subunit A